MKPVTKRRRGKTERERGGELSSLLHRFLQTTRWGENEKGKKKKREHMHRAKLTDSTSGMKKGGKPEKISWAGWA